ncbi:DUF4347 domain-containing protein [Dolichospermum flos-aquae]|uniref:DUF4347 domain-containing protein n=1 Tax=Dolichospermum flos-aquae LEGE 04289 TaxID=1828708 RepID=A0ACC5Q848_DOLFA|nr:DUF4347 domain-containing protein [Dolichospermum flos-aquae]MBE9220435.1 DUF4347 domain-containing protein [Dolichospermum flos-aquae LEGE 04289]
MFNNSFLRQTATTIVFIDASLSDYQTLQTGIIEGVKTVIISQNQDGIEQISQILQQHPHITTIHILSHGAPGCLYLGNSQLNLTNIHNYTQQLQQWQRQNILLYGCNVAAGDAGAEFIHKLHQITNATISASATKTGNAALGGNWELEVNIPENHGTSLLFDAETLNTYQGVFALTLVGVWDRLSIANAVTVLGNYAYAVGDTLEIIDISDPSNPIFKGSYDTFGGKDIQIVGNYAYVAGYGSGLKILDISNPTTPTLKGNYSIDGASGMQVVGNYAYVASSSWGLQIIDISNPTAPTRKGYYYGTFHAQDVQVVGNYAYIAYDDKGLTIIDISNPTNPTLKGNYDTPGRAEGVQVVGNYAYVADGYSGLQIIDISNPTDPTLKSNYSYGNTSASAYDVQVVGNYAYLTGRGLNIIDISNPTTPILKGNYGNSRLGEGVQVVGNYAYVALDGLKIIDISTPSTPTLKGNYDTSGSAYSVQVVGNYAYVAAYDQGLQIFDISNPTTPILKGNYYTSTSSGYYFDLKIVGNYAYVADNYAGLQIIDISNPTTPVLTGNSYYGLSGSSRSGYGVEVVGNYAYMASPFDGLQIIDFTNPTQPTLKGSYKYSTNGGYSGGALGVQVVGNYAYVADSGSGLQIIDISNPTTPTLKGNYDTSGYAYDVQIVGNYAYIADGLSGLQIIDISNPTAPTLKGNYNTSGWASGVQVVGNYAYVADSGSGLQIIDISNPTAPTIKGNYDTYYARGVQVVGNYAYVAAADGGLKIIDVSEFVPLNQAPTNITLSNSNIAENQVIGTVVGNFSSTDPDTGNTFTYSLVTGTGATDNSLFTISGNQLRTNSVFNFETKNSYSIRVKTTDQGGLSFEKQLTIGVSNVNETPTNLTLSNNTVAENQIIGTVVGNLSSTDPDTGNTFTYSLVTGNGATDNSLFTISGNQLRTNSVFDFETKNSYSVRVKTTDQGGLFFERQLTIGVSNVNETPTNLTLSNNTVAENQIIGTVVGNLSTTDTDTGNTFTYSLVTGTGATDNSLFTISGNQLRTNAVFDFETKNSYSVRLRTTDQGGLLFERQLTIGVSNVNETPTNLILSNNTVAENQVIGTVIGNLTTTDLDTANTFTYSLVTGTGATDNSLFTISGNQLRTNAVFDFETKNSYSIRVQTRDQGGLTYQKQLTINISDLTDNTITGTANTNNITTTNDKDIIDAVAGNDTITSVFTNLQQNDNINGGLGTDTLIITGGTTANSLTINANNTTNQIGNIPGTTVLGFERFDLSSFTGNVNFTGIDGNDWIKGGSGTGNLSGGKGNDSLYLGSDTAVDNVNYVLGHGTDTVYQFVRGVGGDKLNFTGIANFDVITSGNSTLVRAGDGIIGNPGFGTGQSLVTLSGTSGFNSTNASLNLFGGTFLFS